MAKSTARHKRESRAVIGESMSISAESIRRAGIVARTFSDGEELLMSGKVKMNKLYKLAKNDNRVGLHILIQPELRDKIKAQAKAADMTVNDMLDAVLTKIFW